MILSFHKYYEKKFSKLKPNIQEIAKRRFELFQISPYAEELRNHELHGKYEGSRSINITGDYRAIYFPKSESAAFFYDIGRHRDLYR